MAGAVAVAHAPGDHVGDGFEATVRMVGKPGDVVAGAVAAKGIEHQKRIQPPLQVLGQYPREFDARPVRRGLTGDDLLDTARPQREGSVGGRSVGRKGGFRR